jgi:hypothetical protein
MIVDFVPPTKKYRFGTASKSARLTDSIVIAIRQADPRISCKTLGERYGCSHVSVWKARTGASWKHVPMYAPVIDHSLDGETGYLELQTGT